MQYRSNEDLSQLIIKGFFTPKVRESKWTFVVQGKRGFAACALGMAYIGLLGDARQAARELLALGMWTDPHKWLAERLNIPTKLATDISTMHLGGSSALEIAAFVAGLPQPETYEWTRKPSASSLSTSFNRPRTNVWTRMSGWIGSTASRMTFGVFSRMWLRETSSQPNSA